MGECLRALYDRALRDQQSAVKAHATRAAALGALAEMGVECLLYVLVYLLLCHRYLAHRAFGLGDLTSLFGATVNLIYFSHALLGRLCLAPAAGPVFFRLPRRAGEPAGPGRRRRALRLCPGDTL